jgi:antitoxin VapB
MTEILVLESDEAIRLARELAERRGVSVDAAIVDSLRLARDALATDKSAPGTAPSVPLTPEQQRRCDDLLELAQDLITATCTTTAAFHSERPL